jgi:hypothetical protein
MTRRGPDRVVDYEAVSQINWARLAAYIDGEGCIRIHQNSPHRKTGEKYHGVMIIVAQRGPELTDWLVENFGGFSYLSKAYPTRTAMHYWRSSTSQSYEILKRCRPYMIVKGEQADVAIEYRETTQSTTRKLPTELKLRREALRLKLYVLKHGHKAEVKIENTA